MFDVMDKDKDYITLPKDKYDAMEKELKFYQAKEPKMRRSSHLGSISYYDYYYGEEQIVSVLNQDIESLKRETIRMKGEIIKLFVENRVRKNFISNLPKRFQRRYENARG